MVVFNTEARIFRGAIPVASNGIFSMAVAEAGVVFAGAGDGSIKRLEGSDMEWKCTGESVLEGKVHALTTRTATRDEADAVGDVVLLAGTTAGRVYTALASDGISVASQELGHVAAVTCVAFGRSRSDVVATGSVDGSIRVWDLSDYGVLQASVGPCEVCSLWLDDELDGTLVSGWSDGVVRGFEGGTGREIWRNKAHRGRVNSVTGTDIALVTCGDDGKVVVWARRTRELLCQFAEHRKPALEVLVDVSADHLVHSVGADHAVYTYDLRTERRIVGHQLNQHGFVGSFTCMSQRIDSEQELVTGGVDGKLLFWDCDVPDKPVLALQDPSKSRVNAITVSPSGKFVAICSEDQNLKVFHVDRQLLVAAKIGHTASVADVQWSPDEKQLVTVGHDACVSVWNFFGLDTE
jgi:WD40 repeat protein